MTEGIIYFSHPRISHTQQNYIESCQQNDVAPILSTCQKKNLFRLQLPNYLLMHLIHELTAVWFESHKNMTRKRKLEISKLAYSEVARKVSWTSHWSVKRDSRSDFQAAALRQMVYFFSATSPPMLFMTKLQKCCLCNSEKLSFCTGPETMCPLCSKQLQSYMFHIKLRFFNIFLNSIKHICKLPMCHATSVIFKDKKNKYKCIRI